MLNVFLPRHYTVRYREKNRKWNYQTCPTKDTVIDNLKPNTVYEFGVQPSSKDGTGAWSKPVIHNVSATAIDGRFDTISVLSFCLCIFLYSWLLRLVSKNNAVWFILTTTKPLELITFICIFDYEQQWQHFLWFFTSILSFIYPRKNPQENLQTPSQPSGMY